MQIKVIEHTNKGTADCEMGHKVYFRSGKRAGAGPFIHAVSTCAWKPQASVSMSTNVTLTTHTHTGERGREKERVSE